MNVIFVGMVFIAFVVGAWNGEMADMSKEALEAAKKSVELAIGLVGYMTLFLGLMKVAEEGGLLRLTAKAIRPIMVRLFPDVPADHPAMGAMILNIASNMVGLTNAATPLGIKAMQELQKLNKVPGVATNAMCLFLVINTSGVALLPSGVVSARAAAGSADPWGIIGSTLFATGMSTTIGIIAAKIFERVNLFPAKAVEGVAQVEEKPESAEVKSLMETHAEGDTIGVWVLRVALLGIVALLAGPPLAAITVAELLGARARGWNGLTRLGDLNQELDWLAANTEQGQSFLDFSSAVGNWVIPSMFVLLLGFGVAQKVKVYETFVKGAKEGFNTGVMIIPYLVAILVAVALFRASGAMNAVTALGAFTEPLGLPAEVLPMAMVRPLSGSGAFGLMNELLASHGPDSYIGYVASTLNGSMDTTFYVMAVYFGAVNVSRGRHAIPAGLIADFAGIAGTAIVCRMLFGALAQ